MSVEPVPTGARAAGPYSPAVRAGDWIVVSGQVGVAPATGELVAGGVEAEARQAMANLTGILADCGCGWEHVAKVTVFVAERDAASMAAVNQVYAEAVGEHRPARSTVGVAWLPLGAMFEIEAWVHEPRTRSRE